MRGKKEPIHRLPGVFRDDAPDADLVVVQRRGRIFSRAFLDRVFVTEPLGLLDWYGSNYHALLKSLKVTPGIKLRIPVITYRHDSIAARESWAQDTIPLLRTFFSIADLIVFSPAPPWKCNYALLDKHPWPEFSYGSLGGGRGRGVYFNSFDIVDWHAAMRPLIKAGKVAYLPQLGWDWGGATRLKLLNLPRLKKYVSDDPFYLARNAFLDLYLDQLISERLGFQHVLPRSSQHPVITSRIALPSIDLNSRRAHIILGIRIPSIVNATFEELWHIQQDEWPSFDAFRRSIQEAVNAAAANARSATQLDAEAKRIQCELIEEPLLKLEERLRRIERIRRRKWAAYALLSTSAALVTAIAPEMAVPVGGALGALSIAKIMETYFTDLEKDVPLSAEALFWLARLREKRR